MGGKYYRVTFASCLSIRSVRGIPARKNDDKNVSVRRNLSYGSFAALSTKTFDTLALIRRDRKQHIRFQALNHKSDSFTGEKSICS